MKRNVPFVEPHTSPFAFSTSTLIAPFPAVTTTAKLVAFIFFLISRSESRSALGVSIQYHLLPANQHLVSFAPSKLVSSIALLDIKCKFYLTTIKRAPISTLSNALQNGKISCFFLFYIKRVSQKTKKYAWKFNLQLQRTKQVLVLFYFTRTL